MKFIHLFLLIAAMILLAACADVDTKSDGTTEVTLPGGGKITHNESGLELPEDFPENMLRYPGAKLTAKFDAPQGSTVSFETSATIPEVTVFYEKKLEENGWKIAGNFKTAGGTMLSATSPGSGAVSLAIAKNKKTGKTVITVIRNEN